VSTEVAIELSTNSHQRPPPETPQERCQGFPCSHYPKSAAPVPLITTRAVKNDLKSKRRRWP
jgi:hypothetical protein